MYRETENLGLLHPFSKNNKFKCSEKQWKLLIWGIVTVAIVSVVAIFITNSSPLNRRMNPKLKSSSNEQVGHRMLQQSSVQETNDTTVPHPTTFCYDQPSCGPDTWGGICLTGKQQSPVNIEKTDSYFYPKFTDFEMNDHYLFERAHRFYAQNNGHTAQFELTPNMSALNSNLTICGGQLKSCYQFAQFHFHWDEVDWDGSEHTIDGQKFSMEMHIVHYKSKFKSFAEALSSNERDAIAVMAVFFRISQDENRELDSIVKAVEKLRFPGKVLEFHLSLSISKVYPAAERREFASYLGSLTTPNCDEKVIWTVFLSPIPISESQMNKFRKVRNEEGVSDFNFRPIQQLNGRKISFYRTGEFRSIN